MSFAEQMYSKIDVDGDGSISKKEWADFFRAFDKDGNNQIDLNEFSTGMATAFGANGDQAKKAFDKIDTDKSGELTVDEIADFFKVLDKDGSGDVSKAEFLAVWGTVF
ncbi:hypothetical protein CAPTEDRAFT_198121 [Capitella teleta]|uniref:EF-hand domain-containing protein n=1 Tax=Capitella teleta TaxID=283909 RepID=X1ZYB2_CAPTE|nr:hypothetical protein CAPTEDRAFT_198121 [Capitella teleta]|eukprot:ELU04671.1 hypothetical protein CAPTEDRAFT_198121 [Capitella teleta]